MPKPTVVAAALTLLFVAPALAAAQSRPVELGLDAALDYRTTKPHVTTISVPVQDLRVGIAMSDRISIEPRFSLTSIKVEGFSATTVIGLGAGLLIHSTGLRHGMYGRPFVNWTHLSASGGSASQAALGAGIGVKVGSEKVIGRAELAYSHAFENDNFTKSDDILLLLGLSFFTH